MKWIMIIAFCFYARGCDINCSRAKRTFGLLADQNDRDALHVHLWNDMDREENYFPNIFSEVTTSAPQDTVNSVTVSALQQHTELPQEQYRKSDRDLYGKFYKLTPRKNKNVRPLNAKFYPSMMNYVANGYKPNVRIPSAIQLPPMVRQSLHEMFQNQNKPNYYTNVPRNKLPRLPSPIENDLIRIATGKIIANEPKPQKYHTFQLHEAMPGQKLLPPTRIPLFKPVPPPIKIVPIIDDDFTLMHVLPHRHMSRPHATHKSQPLQPAIFHPTTFQPDNTHPYPFHTTDFIGMYHFKAHDAMTPSSVAQLTAPTTSTTTMAAISTTDVPTTATTTAALPSSSTTPSTLHATYSRPTYPNVVYAVAATTERSNTTRPPRNRPNRNGQDEFRIMSINNKQRNGNQKGNSNTTTPRPTFGRRRPQRQKQKRRPLPGTKMNAQIKRPMTTITTTTERPHQQHSQKWNHRNETFRIVVAGADDMEFGDESSKTTSNPDQIAKQQEGVVYGRPIAALIVDPPNGTVEVNTPYSKQISNRNDQLDQPMEPTEPTNTEELMNLNRDIKRVLDVTSTSYTPIVTTMADDDDGDDIHNDPLLMENLNKNEMMPIVADNIFDRGDLLTETNTQKRTFTTVNRRSDNVDNVAVNVDSNAIDAKNTKPLNDDKYYKWYSRYAADNKRKYGRAIISEHFKKVEIEPNVAWVILPR